MRRTKIICTIGPASSKPAVLKQMIKAGMNVARLNFSHGTHEEHAGYIKMIREIAAELGKTVAILQDLQGPKIRVGALPTTGLVLKNGQTIHFSPRAKEYDETERLIPVSYGGFSRDVKAGDRILIDDGLLVCVVDRVLNQVVSATVKVGGLMTSHKGVNLPDSSVRLSTLTAKDQKDVAFGVREEVDFMVLSFVSAADDIKKLRDLVEREEHRQEKRGVPIQIVAKIERADAIRRMDEIIKEADAVMVGRGDLGVEIPEEEVPLRQKEIARAARCAGKPVIVATQMLESMKENPRATRAEVSDVANAVIDHADAVMLSAESATGKYPVKAVETLARVAEKTEESVFDDLRPDELCFDKTDKEFAKQIRLAGKGNGLDGIVTGLQYGNLASAISRHRPETPMFVAASEPRELAQLVLRWGVVPFSMKKARGADVFERSAREALEEFGYLNKKSRLLFLTKD
ncbi:MAG: pyruvate kinase [Patescibacteria group bacterium]